MQYDLGPGLRERKVIRRQNRCKPFQYYIDKVKEFGMIHFPENLRNYGWVRRLILHLSILYLIMFYTCIFYCKEILNI
jgi:hypothetical protein